jgi:hypothetical protein
METSPSGRTRRNAKLAIAPVFSRTAGRKRSAPNSKLPAVLPAHACLGEPLRGRLYSRRSGDAPGAHKRSPRLRVTILSRPIAERPATSTIAGSLRQNFPRWLWADLTLLAGDSSDEFRDRSGDRIRNRLLVQTNISQDMMDKDMAPALLDPFRTLG